MTRSPRQRLLVFASILATGGCADEPEQQEDTNGPWDQPAVIESDRDEEGRSPRVAVDETGRAVVVWGGSRIWVSEHARGGGWSAPTAIDDSGMPASEPEIALDASGRGIAVWSQSDGRYEEARVSRYTPEGGWGAPELLGAGASECSFCGTRPQIALNDDGDGLAVWLQLGQLWARTFSTASGWGEPIEIGAAGIANDLNNPVVAVDDAGNAMVVWPADSKLSAARYDAQTGWEPSAGVDNGEGTAYGAALAMNRAGEAVVVWNQDGHVWSKRFADGEWGNPEPLEDAYLPSVEMRPDVAVDDEGNAMAVWHGGEMSIWASRLDASAGWAQPEQIDTLDTDALDARIAMDASGNAAALWLQEDENGYKRVVASTREAGGDWNAAVVIDDGSARPATNARVAVNDNGDVAAAWELFMFEDQGSDIWANVLPR